MKEKSQEKKSGILKATLELIAEQGFHGTSVSQIADKANVNVGSLYYHFTNKDDILNALYLDCKKRITQYAFQCYSANNTVDKRLKILIRNIIRFFSENQQELSFIEQFENSPYYSNIILTEEYANIMKPYLDMFAQLKTQCLIKDLPTGILQNLLSDSVVSLTKYCMNHADALEESILSMAIEAIWDMVKK
ncbi:MAG: TetR/AcrR family transcriptional regulator [Clostridiales bacterium]|nr:TetR/AcrR family transcriptional regulator [Clostridiales bacterium]